MAKVDEIGMMDTLVTLQSCTIGRGAQGQKSVTYADFRNVWARVRRDTDEMVSDYNLEGRRSFILTIHKVPALTASWRVVMSGQAYEITGISDDDRLSPLMTITIRAIKGRTNG